jgi:hypothetical protein
LDHRNIEIYSHKNQCSAKRKKIKKKTKNAEVAGKNAEIARISYYNSFFRTLIKIIENYENVVFTISII